MMVYLTLFLEFFKTGLFAIGGGMATLPFLFDLTKYGWYTRAELMDMIAVAESTPGPIGVNMATYAGYSAGFDSFGSFGGILGAVTATIGLVMPSVIVIILVYKILEKFRQAPIVEHGFYGLRPAVAGLIIVACSELFRLAILKTEITWAWDGIFEWKPLLLFAILGVGVFKFKKLHPIVFILIGAAAGVLLGL